MQVYMDYYITNTREVIFKNSKKSMVTVDGVYKVDENNCVNYTPNPLYVGGIITRMNAKLNPLQDKIDELYLDKTNSSLKDEIINALTNNDATHADIINFLKIFPEYYTYFDNIVPNNKNSETIYDWMRYYDKLMDDRYMGALIRSLHNKDSISIHQLLLCDVINNSHNYNNAKQLVIELKILALELYNKKYFIDNFLNLSHNCLVYNNADNYDSEVITRHKLVHDNIVKGFYDGLPKENQLGVVL